MGFGFVIELREGVVVLGGVVLYVRVGIGIDCVWFG